MIYSSLEMSSLDKQFALKNLGHLCYFLGIQISTLPNVSLHLSRRKYITDLLIWAKMQYAKGMETPMTSGLILTSYGSDLVQNVQFYQGVMGALQYITITMPELAYNVNRVCHFMQTPLESHWQAVMRILWYLSGTLDTGRVLKPCPIYSVCLHWDCDADWESDVEDRRSRSGIRCSLDRIWSHGNPRSSILFPDQAQKLSTEAWPMLLLRSPGYFLIRWTEISSIQNSNNMVWQPEYSPSISKSNTACSN